MSMATVEDLRHHLEMYIAEVEQGREVLISRGDKPIALLKPVSAAPRKNNSQPGWANETLQILGSVTGPIMEEDWEMLK